MGYLAKFPIFLSKTYSFFISFKATKDYKDYQKTI